MSDWLVEFQNAIAAYPSWLVIGAGVIVVAGLFMIIGKVFRVFGMLLLVAVVAAGVWLAVRHLFG